MYPTAPPLVTGTGTGTGGRPLANSTTVRWSNSTATSKTSTTVSLVTSYPTSCGESASAPPFQLQISHPSALIDGFLGLISGRGILFTSRQSSASQFSVESTGHLCVVGLVDGDGMPYVAAVGAKEGNRSAVWMVSRDILEGWGEDYVALECENTGGGGGVACRGEGEEATLEEWVACGVQLWLGGEGKQGDGVGCVKVGLGTVGVEGEGEGDTEVERLLIDRRVDPFGFGVMRSGYM